MEVNLKFEIDQNIVLENLFMNSTNFAIILFMKSILLMYGIFKLLSKFLSLIEKSTLGFQACSNLH